MSVLRNPEVRRELAWWLLGTAAAAGAAAYIDQHRYVRGT